MSIVEQDYLEQIALELKEQRRDTRGHQRQNMASGVETGIQASGLLDEMQTTQEALGRVAAATDQGFAQVVHELSEHRELLFSIVDATQNKRSAEANELKRMGFTAFNNGWYPEAETDLVRSIDLHQYDAAVWFGLGCARSAQEHHAEAADAFEAAIRYGLQVNKPIACGAALLGAHAFTLAGNEPEACRILQLVAEAVPACPEVNLACGLRASDHTALVRALRVASEYAIDAMAKAPDLAEQASAAILSEATNPQYLADRLHEYLQISIKQLEGLGHTGIESPEPPPIMDTATSSPIRLVIVSRYLDRSVGRASEIRTELVATLTDLKRTIPSRLEQARQTLTQAKKDLKQGRIAVRDGTTRVVVPFVILALAGSLPLWTGSVGAFPLIFGFVALAVWLSILRKQLGKINNGRHQIEQAKVTQYQASGAAASLTAENDTLGSVTGRVQELAGLLESFASTWPPMRVQPFSESMVTAPRALG